MLSANERLKTHMWLKVFCIWSQRSTSLPLWEYGQWIVHWAELWGNKGRHFKIWICPGGKYLNFGLNINFVLFIKINYYKLYYCILFHSWRESQLPACTQRTIAPCSSTFMTVSFLSYGNLQNSLSMEIRHLKMARLRILYRPKSQHDV